MASKSNGDQTPAAMPAGFSEVGASIDGWCRITEGKPIHGRIVDFEARHDGSGYLYKIKLIAPTPGRMGDEDTMIPAGNIVALDEKAQLRKLREAVEHRCEVWILPVEKRPTKNGRGAYWAFRIGVKGKRGAIPECVRADSPAPADDQIPF